MHKLPHLFTAFASFVVVFLCGINSFAEPYDLFGKSVEQLDRTLTGAEKLSQLWGQASTLWKAEKFRESGKIWKSAHREAERIAGKDHLVTLYANAWLKRSQRAAEWDVRNRLLYAQYAVDSRIKSLSATSTRKFLQLRINAKNERLKDTRSLFGADSPDVAMSHLALSFDYLWAGQYSLAEIQADKSQKIFLEVFGPTSTVYALALEHRGDARRELCMLSAASVDFSESIKIWTASTGDAELRQFSLRRTIASHASLLVINREFKDADRILEERYQSGVKTSPVKLAASFAMLASYRFGDCPDFAMRNKWIVRTTPLSQPAITAEQKWLAAEVALVKGKSLFRQADYESALSDLETVIQLSDDVEHLYLASAYLAMAYFKHGSKDMANGCLKKAQKHFARIEREQPLADVVSFSINLAEVLRVTSNLTQSRELLKRMLSAAKRVEEKGTLQIADLSVELGKTNELLGKHADADQDFEGAIKIFAKYGDSNRGAVRNVLLQYADAVSHRKDREVFLKLRRRIATLVETHSDG